MKKAGWQLKVLSKVLILKPTIKSKRALLYARAWLPASPEIVNIIIITLIKAHGHMIERQRHESQFYLQDDQVDSSHSFFSFHLEAN